MFVWFKRKQVTLLINLFFFNGLPHLIYRYEKNHFISLRNRISSKLRDLHEMIHKARNEIC